MSESRKQVKRQEIWDEKKSSQCGESGNVRMHSEGETSSCAERTGEQIGPLTCFSLLTKEEDSGRHAS